MQTPPPFQQPPFAQPNQAPKNNSTKIVIIVLACVLGFFCLLVPILAAILFPVFSQAKNAAKNTACMKNVRQLSTAALIYAADNDDVLPFAENWNDAIMKYVNNEDVFHCPGEPRRNFGYAYSDVLSRVPLAKVPVLEEEMMIFDSHLRESNAHSDLSTLSSSGRHTKINIGFADGHVESLKPEQLR